MLSRVMQQGDCNAPDTMHRVCNMMFAKSMGRFVETFYDDVFIFSHTRKAHLRYLEIVFATLWHYQFYLANDKTEFKAPRMEALGAIISDPSFPTLFVQVQRCSAELHHDGPGASRRLERLLEVPGPLDRLAFHGRLRSRAFEDVQYAAPEADEAACLIVGYLERVQL
jgi:hypothetical protein